MKEVKRPLVRYHGGKWKLAQWILSNFNDHRIYCEPFGGGASVLLRKPKSYAEVYNDLDSEIVSLFRVARDRGYELVEKLKLTPFSREDFNQAWIESECELEQARRTVIRAFMGFGSAGASLRSLESQKPATGFRCNSNRSGTTPAHDWANYPKALELIIKRLQGVVIENRDAVECMKQHDSAETLHYVDPPYVMETRDDGADYRFELSDSDHEDLAKALKQLSGFVLVSGYDSELYNDIFSGWHQVKRAAFADGARSRVEVLWMNYEPRQMDFFSKGVA